MRLLRLGALASGHRFVVATLPFAAPFVVGVSLLRLFGLKVHLIISDKMSGDGLLARLFGADCTRMLWNYLDEWSDSALAAPRHKVCFFQEEGQAADLFVFAPQPQAASRVRTSRRRNIVFIGDVTVDLEVPRGADWWCNQFAELRQAHGYGFYLRPEYEDLLVRELSDTHARRSARVLAKNLLRLWIVRSIHELFGDRLTLVGSNWQRFGIPSEPSIYSERVRLRYYSTATVNLDCGSKSGSSTLYPRSSELITEAGGLLQVVCADSLAVFDSRLGEFCFGDEPTLASAIEARLSEPEVRRAERDGWLAERLGQRGLLMQHSIERMLIRARNRVA